MSATGGNLYIWNDGYGIGSSSNSAEKPKSHTVVTTP